MPEDLAAIPAVQQWRRSVVRHWVVTMLAALGSWVASSAWVLPTAVEIGAGMTLSLLACRSVLVMRRGRCPSCDTPIRFQSRIELPPACRQCGLPFIARNEGA